MTVFPDVFQYQYYNDKINVMAIWTKLMVPNSYEMVMDEHKKLKFKITVKISSDSKRIQF